MVMGVSKASEEDSSVAILIVCSRDLGRWIQTLGRLDINQAGAMVTKFAEIDSTLICIISHAHANWILQ